MKKFVLLVCSLFSLIIVGCAGIDRSVTEMPSSNPVATGQVTETRVPTVTLIATPDRQLTSQCLNVESELPDDITSDGIAVFESRITIDGRYKPDTFLINMATGHSNQITAPRERQSSHIVSPNGIYMAYDSVILNEAGQVDHENLVVVDANGQRLKEIPWENGWTEVVDWLDDQRLIINLSRISPEENAGRKPATLLVFNPFSGEQQILEPNFPGYLNTPSTIVPYWDGWSGISYDSTLTRAVFPRFIGIDEKKYTYAIWDITNHRIIGSLENVFTSDAAFNDIFPIPRWSPDGSKFVFRGLVDKLDQVEFNLFSISRDGQIDQITWLDPSTSVQDSNLSWSPDGRYIAMYLNSSNAGESETSVAVLDTVTLNLINYCIPITYSGEGYGGSSPARAIWSPNSSQFLVTDWYQKEHRHVILVDTDKGIAAKIAEDMEPVGWMVAP